MRERPDGGPPGRLLTRRLVDGVWRSVVREEAGIRETIMLTDAEIRALPTTPQVLVPATETPDYNSTVTRLPLSCGVPWSMRTCGKRLKLPSISVRRPSCP